MKRILANTIRITGLILIVGLIAFWQDFANHYIFIPLFAASLALVLALVLYDEKIEIGQKPLPRPRRRERGRNVKLK